jgi:fructosamine-3-kinase
MSTTRLVPAVEAFLREGKYGLVIGEERLHGGITSLVLRLTFGDGRSLVYKESDHSGPGMYHCEADGLRALDHEGCPRVPQVFSVGEDHLLIEDLGPQGEPPPGYWEAFGRALGTLHNVTAPQFGYHRPNYLGTMPMCNDWTDDGHEFFINTRMLNFMEKPKAQETLTAEDRRAVERVAAKIREIVPAQPPSLTHGDLWTGNMLIAHGRDPGLIDPAVYFGWAEADLAMLPIFECIPPVFYDAYLEVHPLESHWRERCDLLAIRDPLCMIAEYGDVHGSLERVRSALAPFA